MPFAIFHRHVAWMSEKHFPVRAERIKFNELKTKEAVLDYLQDNRMMLFKATPTRLTT